MQQSLYNNTQSQQGLTFRAAPKTMTMFREVWLGRMWSKATPPSTICSFSLPSCALLTRSKGRGVGAIMFTKPWVCLLCERWCADYSINTVVCFLWAETFPAVAAKQPKKKTVTQMDVSDLLCSVLKFHSCFVFNNQSNNNTQAAQQTQS
jgi:hypothetical protein